MPTKLLKPKSKRISAAQLKRLKKLETAAWKRRQITHAWRAARGYEAGIQISLRLPQATLAKLERLADHAYQSKSQFITKLVAEIPDGVAA